MPNIFLFTVVKAISSLLRHVECIICKNVFLICEIVFYVFCNKYSNLNSDAWREPHLHASVWPDDKPPEQPAKVYYCILFISVCIVYMFHYFMYV